jgi:hypothetical protein
MKTLRLLRNIAALSIFGAALVVPQPSAGHAAIHHGHGHCVSTLYISNCIRVEHSCVTQLCLSGSSCSHTACVF